MGCGRKAVPLPTAAASVPPPAGEDTLLLGGAGSNERGCWNGLGALCRPAAVELGPSLRCCWGCSALQGHLFLLARLVVPTLKLVGSPARDTNHLG